MEILLLPHFGLAGGELSFFMRPEKTMQFIAVEDIGRIAAKVFADPARFHGQSLNIAGDELSGEDLARRIGAATGRPLRYRLFPEATLQASPLLARLVEMVAERKAVGEADIPALRRLHPGLLSFDQSPRHRSAASARGKAGHR